MHLMIAGVAVFAAWRWGDWRNWKKYYPTILYMIIANFLYNILTYHYPIWKYQKSIFQNHTLTDIFNSFIVFPATLLLYLPNFPQKGIMKKVRYILIWILIYIAAEWILSRLGFFSYYNGWNIMWSAFFNIIMFTMLRVHYKNPLLAWPLSLFIVIFLIWYFDVPIKNLR
jgi:hypothetical protein